MTVMRGGDTQPLIIEIENEFTSYRHIHTAHLEETDERGCL